MTKRSDEQLPEDVIDRTLSRQNATNRGYEYMGDVIYDMQRPSESMQDILKFCQEVGGKLGQPKQDDRSGQYFGLYMPLKDNPQAD